MVKDGKLLVNEIFVSIDGEGWHAGFPSIFFRTVGCNLKCVWCDSKYTWQPEDSSVWMTVEEAYNKIVELSKKTDENGHTSVSIDHITITGGEPLMEENKLWMYEFIKLLLKNFDVDVETNGAIDYGFWKTAFSQVPNFTLITDWKAPSSKMTNLMVASNLLILDKSDIVKIVVTDDPADWEEVLKVLKATKAQVYISPCFGSVDLKKIPEFVIAHSEYTNLRCQIQMHKIFWDPNKRAV
jgi:7-carboxy-7-deazaguanine synthase